MSKEKICQGDVILTRVAGLPNGLIELNPKSKILQQSETHGNHHRFAPTAPVKLYTSRRDINVLDDLAFTSVTPDEGKYIEVLEPSVLYHGKAYDLVPTKTGSGDHNAITLEPGIYKVSIAKTYDYTYDREALVKD